MKIIYKNESGGVSILHPTDEALSFMTIDEIALKDARSAEMNVSILDKD